MDRTKMDEKTWQTQPRIATIPQANIVVRSCPGSPSNFMVFLFAVVGTDFGFSVMASLLSVEFVSGWAPLGDDSEYSVNEQARMTINPPICSKKMQLSKVSNCLRNKEALNWRQTGFTTHYGQNSKYFLLDSVPCPCCRNHFESIPLATPGQENFELNLIVFYMQSNMRLIVNYWRISEEEMWKNCGWPRQS